MEITRSRASITSANTRGKGLSDMVMPFIGAKVKVKLAGSEHDRKIGRVTDKITGVTGCFVIRFSDEKSDWTTFNYNYLEVITNDNRTETNNRDRRRTADVAGGSVKYLVLCQVS